jgi:hypothetical protein
VNVWITATLLGDDGYERNVGTNKAIDPNMSKQDVLDPWHHECRQREGLEGPIDRFPRNPAEIKWADQFDHHMDASWKNDQLIVLDLITKQRATTLAKTADGSDRSTDSTGPASGPKPDAGSGSDASPKQGRTELKVTGYHSTQRQPGTRNVEIAIRFEGQDGMLKVSSKSDDNDIQLKVMKALKINSGTLCTARAFNGLGRAMAYQENDMVILFKNLLERNVEIRNARTTGTLSTAPPAQPKAPKWKCLSQDQKDWIAELMTRQTFEENAHKFWQQIERDKMIHVITDGGANPNPGKAG